MTGEYPPVSTTEYQPKTYGSGGCGNADGEEDTESQSVDVETSALAR